MTAVLRWEDLPPRKHESQQLDYAMQAEELRNHPKRWAVIYETRLRTGIQLAQQINTGTLVAFRPKGHFEAASRTIAGRLVIYARYIGGKTR